MMQPQIVVAVLFGVVALVIWFVFLRPVPVRSAVGMIVRKTYRPQGTYWQFHAGINRGFRTPTPIPIAECYVFEIRVQGMSQPARHTLNMQASESFQERQRVRIKYQQRGLAPFWRRIYVLDMAPADSE